MSKKIWHSAKYDPPKSSSYRMHKETTDFLVYTKDGFYLTARRIYNIHDNEHQWLDSQTGYHKLDVEYWTKVPKEPCKENIATIPLSKDELMEIVEKIDSASGIPEEILEFLGICGKEEKKE